MVRAAGVSSQVTPALRPAPWWLRVFFLVNVAQDFAIGISGALSPARALIPLKGLSPLNTRFVSALYLGGGVVILLAVFVRYAVDARIALYAFLVINVLVLVMTSVYWQEFTVDGTPWLWMTTYIVNPLLTPLILATLGFRVAAEPGRHRLTLLFHAQAIVFGGAGILLTLAPEAAVGIWPWTLTPLLSRVYGSFFLAFAVGALLAARERRRAALRPFLVGSLALLVCTLAASLAHLDRLHEGPSRLLWFAAHVIGVAIFAIAMATLSRGARPRGSPVVAEP